MVGMKDDRAGDDRAGEAASANLIAARHAIEPPSPEGVLEGSHRANTHHIPPWNEEPGTVNTNLEPGTWNLELLLLGLFHARCLALQVAQEVELGAPHTGRPHDVQ